MTIAAAIQAYNGLMQALHPEVPEWVPHNDPDDFKIVSLDKCGLVFGPFPVSAFSKLQKLVPKNSVMDPYIAQLAGANLACGLPNHLATLAERLKPEALRRTREQYKNSGLSDAAITWLAIGERGASSNAIFHKLTGVLPPGMDQREATRHPIDPADIGRCRKLLEQVPEFVPHFPKMAAISPTWERLVARWSELAKTVDQESPKWREHAGSAPQTYALMKTII